MRIASFLASGTEIVYALGLGDQLVAISHECDYPPEALDKPRVTSARFDPSGLTSGGIDTALRDTLAEHGSAYRIDPAGLARAAPDLILTQDVCEVCAVPTPLAEEAIRVLARRPVVLSLDAHDMAGIMRSIRQVGDAAGAVGRAGQVIGALEARLAAVRERAAGAPAPRVLVLEWLDPPFVPGHWGPEMVTMAHGENLIGQAGKRSRELTWDDLANTDPDVLIVAQCGYGLAQARSDADQHREKLNAIAGRAIREHRAFVADGSSYFNRSGPRAVDGVEIVAAILHPDRFPDFDPREKAERWG